MQQEAVNGNGDGQTNMGQVARATKIENSCVASFSSFLQIMPELTHSLTLTFSLFT
jgi:hypothetical protein